MKTAYIAKQRQISFVKSHFSRQLEETSGADRSPGADS